MDRGIFYINCTLYFYVCSFPRYFEKGIVEESRKVRIEFVPAFIRLKGIITGRINGKTVFLGAPRKTGVNIILAIAMIRAILIVPTNKGRTIFFVLRNKIPATVIKVPVAKKCIRAPIGPPCPVNTAVNIATIDVARIPSYVPENNDIKSNGISPGS